MQLADKIRIIRKARGLSQEGLGYSLSRVSKDGVSRQAVSDWENGKSEPCLENIRDLAEVLGVSFDALLDESIDLDDPQVLNAVLSKQTHIDISTPEEKKSSVGRSINYRIHTNALSIKKFKITLSGVICALIAIILIIVGTQIGFSGLAIQLLLYLFSLAAFSLLFIVALTLEIIPAIRGKVVNYFVGSIDYGSLDIDDKYIKMEGYENIGNHLYINIENIIDIELGTKQQKRYGDVEVIIKDKEHPMIIRDVMHPKKLIETYKKIVKTLEEIKGDKE